VQAFHSGSTNYLTRSGSCQLCPTPTPTPTPTLTITPTVTVTPTLTPTQTVTPLPGSGYYDGGYGCQYYNYDPGFPTCDPSSTVYDVYQQCGTLQYYYIEHNSSYGIKGLINGTDCGEKVETSVTQSYINTYYPDSIQFNSFVTNNCDCN
jgi:hypothetical protein